MIKIEGLIWSESLRVDESAYIGDFNSVSRPEGQIESTVKIGFAARFVDSAGDETPKAPEIFE